MKRIFYSIFLVVLFFIGNNQALAQATCGTSGYTNPLTAANGFNVFAKQGVTFMSGNSDGTIAMGGNATLNGSFTVAMANSGSHPNAFNNSSNYGFVIGGGVTYTSGSTVVVNNGFLRLGSTTGSRLFYTDCNNATTNLRITKNTGGACLTDFQSTPRIDLQRQQTSPTATGTNGLDFNTAFTTLAAQSTTLSTYNASAPCSTSLQIHSVGSGSISLTLTAHKVNVINLTGTQLNAITQITFHNQPSATQPLVINVNQTSSFSWSPATLAAINNASGRFVIFNFYNNTGTVTLTGANTVVGSVLVPNGHFTKNHVGNIEGQVVAQNIVLNGGEVHYQPFEACLINCTSTCTALTSGGTIATSQQYCASSVTPTAFTSSANASGGTGGTIKYQWQKLESCGSFIDISGATSSTYTSGSISKTTIFRRKAWRDCSGGTGSNPVYSNELTVLVVNAGTITGNQTGTCNYSPTAITGTHVAANNYCLSNSTAQNQTYQWQQSIDGGANWTNISGATAQNFTPSQLQQTTQYRRATIVSSYTCYSNVITKTVTTTATVVSNESFPNTFNTGFAAPINSTFTGSIGTWNATSTNKNSTVVINSAFSQSSPNALKLVNYNNGAASTTSTSNAQSPTVNLSAINTANTVDLSFRLYTYTLDAHNTCFSFNVEYSSNNGSTWTNVYSKTAQELVHLFGSSAWSTITLPIPSAYFNSSFKYRFTGVSRANCCYDSYIYLDDVKITSNQSCTPCPTTTNAGANQTKCNNSSFTMAATAAPAGSTGTWSVVSGAATIASANSATTTITVTTSPATLRWTVTTPNCGNITSDVVLTNTIVTTANAGSAQTKCNNSSFTMAANAVASGETGAWSVISGAATITTASSATTAVTVTTSPVTLRWTITRGSCTSTSDVVLTNTIVTTANAGSAQTKCNNSSFTMAANAAGSGETGAWSVVGGAASITTASSATTAVTVTTSPAILRWTITRGSCTSTSDVVLTVSPSYTIGNFVWFDANNNGLQDGTEVGIGSVTVKLYADNDNNNLPDGSAIASTVTNGSGVYSFTNQCAGRYIVSVVLPSNYVQGATTSTSADPNNSTTNDNNGVAVYNTNEIRTNSINLTSTNNNVDFALLTCENATETFPNQFNTGFSKPLNNATFTGSTGAWTTTTSSNATIVVTTPYYLTSSSHAIKVVNWATNGSMGEAPTPGVGSTLTTSPLINLSSVCCPSQLTLQYTLWTYTVNSLDNNTIFAFDFSNDNGVTWNQLTSTTPAAIRGLYGENAKVNISLPIPQMYQTANFRYRIRTSKPINNPYNFYVFVDDIKISSPTSCAPTLSVGDYVWLDDNNNGLQDVLENGVSGATVKLYYDLNNDNIPDGAAIATTTTNSTGAYSFNNLGAYRYIVSVVLPTGYTTGTTTSTSADPNNSTSNDNNGVAIINTNEVRSNSINLTSTNNNVDFGLKGTLNLGNLVWNDTNGNGVKNTFESGVPNVTVYLYQDANSDNIPDGSAIATVTTNASGIYSFTNLAPGNYIVGIVPPTGFAKSFTPTSGLTPNNDTDNDNNGVGTFSGIIRTNFITLTVGGEPASGVDGDGTNGNLTLDLAIAKDTDGDKIPDVIDIDDDNDGITDLNESGGYDPLADCDNDGTPNYLDSTPGCTTPTGNDPWGVPYKPLVWTDCNNDGVNDFFDWDRDGVINELDLDSDNDGILDVTEARPNGTAFTSVLNGMITGTDVDGNGLLSSAENNNSNPVLNGLAAQDMDRDGTPNFLDLDSDGDGITDLTEALGVYSTTGVVSGTDTDGDGVRAENFGSTAAATADNINGFGARGILLQDNDTDGKPNAYDIDSDNDGITDNAEGQATCSYKLPTGNDCDGDGVDDAYDMGGCTSCLRTSGGITPFDKDGDGTPDYIDLDTDNDGSLDIYEGHTIPSPTGNVPPVNYWVGQHADTDNDGLINFFDGFNIITATGGSYWRNVINNNMGNNGSFDTGTSSTGSISQLPKSQVSNDCNVGDRDWRNITILPVTLLEFRGNLNNSIAKLVWSVTSEVNMNQYSIERSADGVNFTNIATVNANNSVTSNVVNYTVNDNLAGFNGTTVYYRLKMIEKDGSFKNSNIISFKLSNIKGGVSIMPNPAVSFVNIKVAAIKDGTAAVKVIDMLGKVVLLQNSKVLIGINTFTFNNLSTLSAGTYTVQVMVDGMLYNEKLIVTK